MMLRFDSLEQLGEWAVRYGAQELHLGEDGRLSMVRFAAVAHGVSPDGLDDAPEAARPRSDVDVAAENLLRGYPHMKGGAGA